MELWNAFKDEPNPIQIPFGSFKTPFVVFAYTVLLDKRL